MFFVLLHICNTLQVFFLLQLIQFEQPYSELLPISHEITEFCSLVYIEMYNIYLQFCWLIHF